MSEDRTQEPSTLRRLQARERGQVARSPELTGAVGLLAASALVGIWGDDLALALVDLVRAPWTGDLGVGIGLDAVADRVRRAALGVAGPLLGIVGGSAGAAVAAHQAQVGGLFVPGLLAPDPTRLWSLRLDEEGSASGNGPAARAARGAWSVLKAAVVVAVAAWSIRSGLGDLHRLARLDPPELARGAASILSGTALALALATLALGLVDFALGYRRFEAMLRMTDQEHREDQKAADGDPALRTRRRRQARALRGDAPELLAGASLVVAGPGGLVAVLAGGPPPRRVTIRSTAKGATGRGLLKAAESAGVAVVDEPGLALGLARVAGPTPPPELSAALAATWPI